MVAHRWHRGIVLVVVVLTTMVAWVPSAEAATVYVGAHQYNMCGSVCHQGNTVATDPVVYFVGIWNPRPWIVTTNEVCTPQWNAMTAALGPLGYSGFRTINKTIGGTCGSSGMAMFLLGSPVSSWGFTHRYPSQAPGDQDIRYLRCQLMSAYLGLYSGCVTHLSNNRTYAGYQSQEALGILSSYYSANMILLGGDLNLPAPNWTNYWDIDPFSRFTYKIPNVTERLDYIFGDKAHLPSTRSTSSPVCSGLPNGVQNQDHCYVAGRFLLYL